MTAEDLRKSILQQAIQGKLVPQDPNDEPASELLSKIRAEKERLIKEKKIKRDKNETIIYRGDDNSYYEKILATGEVKCIDDEIAFEIPQGWEWCRLGELITYQNGYSYTSAELNKECKGLPVIKSGNLMTYEVILKPNNDYVESPSDKMLASLIRKGDMLMCLSSQSDNLEPLGKTAIYRSDNYALLNQRVLKMRPHLDEILDYLYYVINSEYFHYTVSHQSGGSAQANLKLGHVLSMLVPIAPFEEELRIVNKISKLNPFIAHYDFIQQKESDLNNEINNKLKKSILQEAIQGRLVEQRNEDGSANELLQHIKEEQVRLFKDGKLKKSAISNSVIFRGDDNKYYEKIGTKVSEITDEIPYELPTNWEFVRLSSICWLEDGEKSSGEKLPYMDAKYHRGKDTTFITSGKVVNPPCKVILVDGENSGEIFNVTERGYLGSTFKVLQMSTLINEEWLHLLLDSYRELFKGSKVGAAIPHLNKTLFRNLIVGIPPYSEQNRITKAVKRILSIIESY